MKQVIIFLLMSLGLVIYAQTIIESPTPQSLFSPQLPQIIQEDDTVKALKEADKKKEQNLMIPDCREVKNAANFWKEVDGKFYNTVGERKESIPKSTFKDVIYRGSDGVGVMTCEGIVYVCKNEMPDYIWFDIELTFELIE